MPSEALPQQTASRRLALVLTMLRPVARAAVRLGVPIQEIVPLLKVALVDAAEVTLQETTQKVNASRMSLVTGIHRSEIQSLREKSSMEPTPSENILGKVIGQWEQDRRYTTKSGEPRMLSCDGEGSEFFDLVLSVNTNFNPATVLFELSRNKTVERTARGVRLLRSHALFSDDQLRAYDVLCKDLDTLGQAVDENLHGEMELGHLHIRTEYDNIYRRHLPKIREWLVNEGKSFHKKAREFLSAFDKDVNPQTSGGDNAGVNVVLGAFSYINDPTPSEPYEIPSRRSNKKV